ncbi:MAG: hypothetical protein WAN48_12685 [Actinomycetes bacterium]
MPTTGTDASAQVLTRVDHNRRRVRLVAAGLSGALAAFYLGYFFVVHGREAAVAPQTESSAPVFLFASVLFVLGAVLLVVVDQSVLWAVGSLVPLLAVALYGWNGIHGVWDDPLAGAVVSVAEAALFTLLIFLAVHRPT